MNNHYIVGRVRLEEGFKLIFGKIQNKNGNIVEGYVEKGSHNKSKRALFEIPVKDIVLDLGETPHPGKVYGFDTTNLYTGKVIHHDFFGPIHFFYRIKKEPGRALMAAFDRAAKILEKLGFEPMRDCIWMVQHPDTSGKYAGYYTHSPNTEKVPHTLAIKPEMMLESDMVYVIAHEFAHYVHANLLTQKGINAKWIKLFNTSIKVQTIRKEDSIQLMESLLDGEATPSDYRTGLDEEQKLAWNWIMRTIKADHALTIKELDTLFEAEGKDEIRNIWPKRTLHKKDLAPVISEYATVSYRELFAECFAFYATKRKPTDSKEIPPKIVDLLEKSIRIAKTQQERGG